jgi:hypothetical protein
MLASVLAPMPAATEFFPLLFWIHVAVVILGIWAIFKIPTLKSTWAEAWQAFFPVPTTLIVVGVLAAVVAGISAKTVNLELGKLPDGTAIHSKSWTVSNGKYLLSLNKQPAVEITKDKYQELQRETYSMFALAWVILSYIIALHWHYIARGEEQKEHAS